MEPRHLWSLSDEEVLELTLSGKVPVRKRHVIARYIALDTEAVSCIADAAGGALVPQWRRCSSDLGS